LFFFLFTSVFHILSCGTFNGIYEAKHILLTVEWMSINSVLDSA
jgi:hypothetical protein